LELEILPSLGRKCRSSGGSTTAVRSAGGKRSGPLVSTSRRSSGGATRRRSTAVGSHSEIPSAVGSGEDAQSLASGEERTRRKDLSRQIWSRYPSAVGLDRSCTRFTIGNRGEIPTRGGAIGISAHREIGILEVKKIETLQVSKHREDLDRPLVETRGRSSAHRTLSASGNRHSRGQEIGESPG
jgi:hypothetical protein